jgi:hypothetical protein
MVVNKLGVPIGGIEIYYKSNGNCIYNKYNGVAHYNFSIRYINNLIYGISLRKSIVYTYF